MPIPEELQKLQPSLPATPHKDAPGGVNLYDESGNVVDTVQYDPSRGITGDTNQQVYRYTDASGNTNYTADPTSIPSIVDFNEETGKFTVTAPDLALQNENFRNNLNDTLKTLTQNYKVDKNFKYNIVDANGNNQEKSIQDIVNDLNAPAKTEDGQINSSSISGMASAAVSIEMTKSAYKDAANQDFTDEDAMRVDTFTTPESQDNALQLISDLPEAEFLRTMTKTYDSATGMAQYKDIMDNAWNKEKVSGEDMNRLIYALRNYFEKGDFSDKDAYIKNVATWKFVNANQPQMSWIRDVAENVSSAIDGVLNFAADLGTAVGAGVGELQEAALKQIYGANYDLIKTDTEYLTVSGGTTMQELGFADTKGLGYDKVDSYVGDVVIDPTTGVPTYKKDAIKVEGSYEKGGAENWLEATRAVFKEHQAIIQRDLQYLHASQNGWEAVGYGLTQMAALISAGNVLSTAATTGATALAGKIAKTAASATSDITDIGNMMFRSGSALGMLEDANMAQAVISGMGQIYDIANASGKAGSFLTTISNAVLTSKTGSTMIGLVGESLAEAIVGDPNRLTSVLKSGELDDDTKSYLMQTFVGNAIGWGVGITTVKGLMMANKTVRGQAVSQNIRRKLFAVQNAVGDAYDNLLLRVRRIGGENLDTRIQALIDKGTSRAQKQGVALAENALLRDARQAVIDAGSVKIVGQSTEEIDEALDSVRTAVNKYEAVENAITSANKQGMDVLVGWIKNDNFGMKDAVNNFYKKAGDIADAEKAAGDLFRPQKGAVSDFSKDGKTIHLFSQTTTNYIKATEKMAFIDAYIARWENAADATDAVRQNIKRYTEEKANLQSMIDTFTKNATPELQTAADNFIDADRKFWNAFENLRSDKSVRLTSADTLRRYRESGLWGDNGDLYARTTRQSELSEYTVAHRNGQANASTFDDYERYMAGATGDFVDPMGEMQVALRQAAQEHAYVNITRTMDNLTGTLTTKVAGKDVELVNTLKKGLRKNYEETTRRLFVGLSEDAGAKVDDVIKKLKVKIESKVEVNKAKRALKTIEQRLETGATPVTAKSASRYTRTLTNEETDELWNIAYGRSQTDLLGTTRGGATVEDVLDRAEGVERSRQVARETRGATRQTGADSLERAVSRTAKQPIPKTTTTTEPLEEAIGRTAERGGRGIAPRDVVETPRGTDTVTQTVVEPSTGKGVPSQVRNIIYDRADKMGITYNEDTPLSQIYREIKETTASPVFDDATFDLRIKQGLLTSDKAIMENQDVLDYLSATKQARFEEQYLEWQTEQTENLEKFSEQYDISVRELNEMGVEVTDGYVDSVLAEGSAPRQAIEELCRYYGVEGDETAMRYFALQEYVENKSKFKKELGSKIADMAEKDHKGLTIKERNRITGVLTNSITDTMDEEANNLRLMMSDIAPDAVAEENAKVFDEVKSIQEEIEGARANQYSGEKNVVALVNPQGQLEYYETDPLLAGLVNFNPVAQRNMGALTKTIYNTNYLWSKLFRLGTTAINVKSMVSQMFRDPINMIISGGTFRTTKSAMRNMVDVFGDDLVKQVEAFEPEAFTKLQRTAEETGRSLQELTVERELALGRAIAPGATETGMYKSLQTAREARISSPKGEIYDVTVMDRVVESIDNVGNKLGKLNEIRETSLRNISYANGLNDALEQGFSLAQARQHATFVMNEATTNFLRLTGHLTALRDTVPYLGAAINGTKSFWRLLTVDPVGVMGRLTGGLIIPIMALTAYSLADEENRKVYQNIKEYEKEDNFVFVVHGQAFTIPLPQEMSAFIAPFRQFVEALHGTANNTFDQFFWNDILGFSPIELRGFADLDFAKLESSSPGFTDRIGEGVMKMWSQLAPAPLKSGLEIITGVDPYTGKQIDTSYVDYDEDGNPIVKDYKSGVLARNINNMFNSWGWKTSAPVVQNVLSNIFGQASVDILDFLGSLAEAVPNGGLQWSMDTEALEKNEAYNPFYTLTERLTAPIQTEVYDEAQSAWKAAVTALYAQKDEILRSDAWQEYLEAKRNTTDPEKLKNINSSKKDLVEDYFNTIKTVVTNLQKNYGEQFTAAKYATVLSLMTMDEQTLDGGSYGNYLNKEEFKTARAQAIQTMIQMGFPSATGQDILGQYRVNSDGEIYVQTNHPLAILQLDDRLGGRISTQSNRQHYATIKNIIDDGGAYDLQQAYYDEKDKAYDNKDYDKVEQLANEYNEKILRLIDPYIQQYGAKSVLQGDALDYLAGYIDPPSSAMGAGKYWKSNSGVGASKHDAFAKNYLRVLYGLKESN